MNTDSFKSRLLDEKRTLEAELEDVGRKNPANKADWEPEPQEVGQEADPNDVASELQGYGDNAAVLNDLELRYNEVLAALARIEEGKYGVCEVSGEPIEEERLNADPTARTCEKHLKA